MTENDIKALFDKIDGIESKVDRIHQGLYGVPDTDDKGLLGKVNSNCEKTDDLENRLTKVEVRAGVLSSVISLGVAIGSWFASR